MSTSPPSSIQPEFNSTNVISPSTLLETDVTSDDLISASVSNSKIMLKNVLINNDIVLHSKIGEQVMNEVFKIVEVRGYNKCFGHKMKGLFIKSINCQLHAVDGPLSHIKKDKSGITLKGRGSQQIARDAPFGWRRKQW